MKNPEEEHRVVFLGLTFLKMSFLSVRALMERIEVSLVFLKGGA